MRSRNSAGRRLLRSLVWCALVAVAVVGSFYWSRNGRPKTSNWDGTHRQDASAPDYEGTRTLAVSSQETLIPPTPPEVHSTQVQAESPTTRLDVVVAHYEEEPHWISTWLEDLRSIPSIQQLGLHVTIYTKGASREPSAIQEATGADAVVSLPNVGREGSTYLNHILTHYDNLPAFTLFTQAYLKKAQQASGPRTGHLEEWLVSRLTNTLDASRTGFMSLDRKHDICHCGHCTDMGRDDFYPLWPPLYTLITGNVCLPGGSPPSSSLSSSASTFNATSIISSSPTILSFNGHFIVSRARILSNPRSLYAHLLALVDAPLSDPIHDEIEPKWFDRDKGKSKPSNPKFGHTLERLWHTLFRCDRVEWVEDCDVEDLKAELEGVDATKGSEVGKSTWGWGWAWGWSGRRKAEEGKGGCSCPDIPGHGLEMKSRFASTSMSTSSGLDRESD